MFIFGLLAIVLIFWYFSNDNQFKAKQNNLEDSLKMRYINGEIDEETYKRMKKNIEN